MTAAPPVAGDGAANWVGPLYEAAATGRVPVRIVRAWVVALNTHGPAGVIDRKGTGPRPLLKAEHRAALAAASEAALTPAVLGVVRLRIVDLVQWLWDRCQVAVSKQTLGRGLRAKG